MPFLTQDVTIFRLVPDIQSDAWRSNALRPITHSYIDAEVARTPQITKRPVERVLQRLRTRPRGVDCEALVEVGPHLGNIRNRDPTRYT